VASQRAAAPSSDASPSELVQTGQLSIDARTRQVHRAGALVALTATEFDVLWCLVQGGGRVLTREEIQSAVWGPKHHGTRRTIDNFMMQLRTKLERDPSEPDYLLTVRGVGYRLKL
jgi:DNA-binding response OmpR family regulator